MQWFQKLFSSRSSVSWKDKAKARRLENKALKKRIQELTESREKWKLKAQQRQAELEQTKQQLKNGPSRSEIKKKRESRAQISPL
jgi:regulator of replication initiation timing